MRVSISILVCQTALLSCAVALRLTAQEYRPAASSCRLPVVMAPCTGRLKEEESGNHALPAGDAPAFLFAAVQLIEAPGSWRKIYHQVEQCAGRSGDYDAISWAVMEAPLQGPQGATYAFVIDRRIVLIRGDTTYLRHEMLHHILAVGGWQPPTLQAGERYTIADLHPMPLFGLCTGGVQAGSMAGGGEAIAPRRAS
jgi:hypothetical protein